MRGVVGVPDGLTGAEIYRNFHAGTADDNLANHAFEGARRAVREVPPTPERPGLWDNLTTFGGVGRSFEHELNRVNAANDHNVAVMERYETQTRTQTNARPEPVRPPGDGTGTNDSTSGRPGQTAPNGNRPPREFTRPPAGPAAHPTPPPGMVPGGMVPGGFGPGGRGPGFGPRGGGGFGPGGAGGHGMGGFGPGGPVAAAVEGAPAGGGVAPDAAGGGNGRDSGNGRDGGRGQGRDERDHERPSFLVEPDSHETFGSDEVTAPPVIGG